MGRSSMIVYGFSIQGKSHIERGAICQDYNKYLKLCDGWYLGAVADGVGSAAHSDIGSETAVESLCEYCKKHIKAGMADQEIEDMIRLAYEYALESVMRYAEDNSDSIEEYDTTLSAALYNGNRVIYGHSGDGGILVRQCDGQIKPITKRQKGADGSSVLPLRAGISAWDFGIVAEKAAAVLLATDGMLDGVFQPVLVNLPSDAISLAKGDFSNDNAYITVSEFFMNPNAVYQNSAVSDADALMNRYMQGELDKADEDVFLHCIQKSYIKLFGEGDAQALCQGISKYYYAVWALKNVTDDKSVVCMMNEEAELSPQSMEYYQEPNWKWRQESYTALLYGKPLPVIPDDDPLYYGKRKSTELRKGVVFENDMDVYPRQIAEQIEGKDKEQRLQQYLKPQRKKKIISKKSFVTVCACCLFVCGGIGLVKMKMRTNKADISRYNAKKPMTTVIQKSQVTGEPKEENTTSASPGDMESPSDDNGSSIHKKLSANEEKHVREVAKNFVIKLAEYELFSSSRENDSKYSSKDENRTEDQTQALRKFQKVLKNKGLTNKLSNFVDERVSGYEREMYDVVLSSDGEVSNWIQDIIDIVKDESLAHLGKKTEFVLVFREELETQYDNQKDREKQNRIIKNLKVLLDKIPETQNKETVSPEPSKNQEHPYDTNEKIDT